MPILQFTPFSSLVQPSLWHKLSDLKIDVLKLSDAAVPLKGSYTIGKTVTDRETGQDIALSCNLTVGGEGFEDDFKSGRALFLIRVLTILILTNFRPPHGSIAASGTLKNFNTIEEFKAADKNALFNQEAQLVSNRFSFHLIPSNVLHILDLGSYPRSA